MSHKDWYLVYCKSREEERAKLNFAQQGIDSYLPKVAVRKLRGGKQTTREEPLFPSYLFIQVESANTNFNSLRSTRGVAQLVRTDGAIKPVPSSLVHALMSHEDNDQQRKLLDEGFDPGDLVELQEGPYQGVEAIYKCADGLERSILLLKLMSQEIEVTADNIEIRRKKKAAELKQEQGGEKD